MKKAIVSFLIIISLSTCSSEEPKTICSTPATIRDLTGFDGCGWVFELNDGSRIIPILQFYCGTPPLPKTITEDPLYNYELVDGKKVLISYEVEDRPNTCMVGPMVKIKCISDAPQVTPGEN